MTARDSGVTKRVLHPAPGAGAGSTLVPGGVDFALWAPRAAAVELCLFDDAGTREVERLQMHGPRAAGWQGVWHGHLPDAAAGLVYGYRVHGPWAPDEGHRFNPAKVLLDPWAREVVGHYRGQESFLAHDPADVSRPSRVDNAADALKARVIAPWTPLARIARRVPDDEVVLYEVHVKAATKLHPGVPEVLRGTYEGLAHPAFVDHVKRLGVTTLSLLPVHQRADEPRLLKLGLTNHWGYNTVGFFAAEPRFASQPPAAGPLRQAQDRPSQGGRAPSGGSERSERGGTYTGSSPMAEFRAMVTALHDAGLEVVIDVVYNHTAEGDEDGPTFHLRGIDNAAYYHQRQHAHAHGHGSAYENWTGCGHSLNLAQPRVVQLVIESLRYWAVEGGVDGFRFDLAPVLARGTLGEYSQAAGFFAAIQADPLLRTLRLISEPWDIGPGGYRVGDFPPPWVEWNDRFRDTTRAFWLGGGASRGELAHKVAGSSRAFRKAGRSALSSVNFVTAHDGFTLRDLVSYERKHNDANGEHNRDGHGHNLSINAGVEGPSDDAEVLALRARLQRALLATLAVSQGTPMLLAGDEIGHSQRGNNNAYCQDNAITWLDWSAADAALSDFVAHALALRRELPALRSPRWHDGFGVAHDASSEADLAWYAPDGKLMTPGDWEHGRAAPLQARFDGAGGPAVLLLMNPTAGDATMILPRSSTGTWTARLRSDDTASPAQRLRLGQAVSLPPRCLWVAVSSA